MVVPAEAVAVTALLTGARRLALTPLVAGVAEALAAEAEAVAPAVLRAEHLDLARVPGELGRADALPPLAPG